MDLVQAVILAVIEGLTEFLPVSSTGHMLMVQHFFNTDPQAQEISKTYIVAVQFGAVLSVLVAYWRRFFKNFDFYFKIGVGSIPAGILGFLLHDQIDMLQENKWVLMITMIGVGIILIFLDDWYAKNRQFVSTEVTYKQAFIMGCFQAIALIPGVSRSAATIFGGLSQRLNWKQATEFSFFLALPIIGAATVFKLYKNSDILLSRPEYTNYMILGNVISFIVALITVTTFIRLVQKIGFRYFGIYRIIIGLIFFATVLNG